MKLSRTVVAIMASAIVVAAPTGKPRPVQVEADAIGPVGPTDHMFPELPDVAEYHDSPGPLELLRPNLGPGLVVPEWPLPSPVETNVESVEVVGSKREEKRSEDIALDRPDSMRDAPFTVPYTQSMRDRMMENVREFMSRVNPGDVNKKDFKTTAEEYRKIHDDNLAEWYREVRKGKGNAANTIESVVIPEYELPEVRKEEKRSEDVESEPPASWTEAPHRVPHSDRVWKEAFAWTRDIFTEDDLKLMWEDAKKKTDEWYAERLREAEKGEGSH